MSDDDTSEISMEAARAALYILVMQLPPEDRLPMIRQILTVIVRVHQKNGNRRRPHWLPEMIKEFGTEEE